MAQIAPSKETPPPQRRPRRLQKSINSLSSSLTASLSTTTDPSLSSSTMTSQTFSSTTSRRSFNSSLRDRRGLAASTGGSLNISFVDHNGLDQVSMREILSGFDSDDDSEGDDGGSNNSGSSVDSFLEELRRRQKDKEKGKNTKGHVKFNEVKFDEVKNKGRREEMGLEVIESGSSMHFDADDL